MKAAVALLEDPGRHPPERHAGHSPRAGFVTQAAAAGVAVTVRYIRLGQHWQDNPSAALGL